MLRKQLLRGYRRPSRAVFWEEGGSLGGPVPTTLRSPHSARCCPKFSYSKVVHCQAAQKQKPKTAHGGSERLSDRLSGACGSLNFTFRCRGTKVRYLLRRLGATSPEALEPKSGQCDPQQGSTELRVGFLPWVHQSAGIQPLCSIAKEYRGPRVVGTQPGSGVHGPHSGIAATLKQGPVEASSSVKCRCKQPDLISG